MEAVDMFLVRHRRLHTHVDRLIDGLTENQIREPVHSLVNPLAWLLWHVARTEDSAINLMICDEREVLDDDWSVRLNVLRRDAGTGMTMPEVLDLSRSIHLPSLMAYWKAVGERTASVIEALKPLNLDEVVSEPRVDHFVEQVVEGPTVTSLKELFKGTTLGHFLVWLPLTHNYEHVGQADLIRGLLGRPGRF
jgi:hypothetical protein